MAMELSTALKQPLLPAAGFTTLLLADNLDEAVTTDISTHSPDTNNTGHSYLDPAGKNPMEVVGGGGHARSKYVTGYTTGWALIDLGVSDIQVTLDMDPYAAAYLCTAAWAMDAAGDNGWLFGWSAAGSIALYQRTGNANITRDSASVAASAQLRRVVVTHAGSSITADFNNGEATLAYSSAYAPGTYAGFTADRKDSGWHQIHYWQVMA